MEKFVGVLIKKRHFLAAWKAAEYLDTSSISSIKGEIMDEIIKRGDLDSFEKLFPLFNPEKEESIERMINSLLGLERISEAKKATKLFSSKEKKNMYKEILSLVKEEVRGFFI